MPLETHPIVQLRWKLHDLAGASAPGHRRKLIVKLTPVRNPALQGGAEVEDPGLKAGVSTVAIWEGMQTPSKSCSDRQA